jgi:hypothetical protein
VARAFASAAAPDDDALTAALDEVTAVAALDGTLPHGTFGEATRDLQLDCLRTWRARLIDLGGLEGEAARVYLGGAPEGHAGVTVRPAPRLLTDVRVPGAAAPLELELHAQTNLLGTVGGAPAVILASSSATKENGYGRDRLSAFFDHLALAASDPEGSPRRRGVVLRPGQSKPEAFWLRPVAREDALAYLTGLANELLSGVHPYFFPCEAVLGWRKKKEPRPDLLGYIHTLRDSDWKTYFTSDWGPIPKASEYPLPPDEDTALRLVEARFGLYFATIEDDAAPERGARKPATPRLVRGGAA